MSIRGLWVSLRLLPATQQACGPEVRFLANWSFGRFFLFGVPDGTLVDIVFRPQLTYGLRF
jgi:hypothetical protein